MTTQRSDITTKLTDMPHQIATRAIGATVFVTSIRDPADGTAKYSVTYQSRAVRWLSERRFSDAAQAEAAGRILSEFLGASFR